MDISSIDTGKFTSEAVSLRPYTILSLARSGWRRLSAMLRRLTGHFSGRFIRPVIGFGFDLTGAIYRVDGCRFEIPVHLTDRNYRSAFVLGEYESGERKLVRRFLRAEDRVIELGGCIGVLSCLVNSKLIWRTHHLVVEANPELVPLLRGAEEVSPHFNLGRFEVFGSISIGRSMDQAGTLFLRSTTGSERVIA